MQPEKTVFWQEKAQKILKQCVTPSNLPQQKEEQQRIRALLTVLLAIFFLGSLVTIIRYLAAERILIEFVWVIAALVLYLLAKRGFYMPVVHIMIGVSGFFALGTYGFLPDTYFQPQMLYVALISMMIAMFFTNLRTTLYVVIGNLLVVLFLLTQIDLPSSEIIGQSTIIFFLAILIITMSVVNGQHPQQVQRSHDGSKNRQQFNYLFDTFPKAIIIQANGKIIYSNASAERLLQKQELDGCLMSDFIAEDEIRNSRINNQYGTMIVNYDTQLRLANEQTIPLRVTTQLVSYQKQLATLMLLQPADSSLEDSHLINAIVGRVNQALIVFDTSVDKLSNITFVNRAFCDLAGFQENELLNQDASIFHQGLNGQRSLANELQLALDTGKSHRSLDLRMSRRDGTSLSSHWDTELIYDEQGKAQYCVAFVSNIDEKISNQFDQYIIQQAVVSELGLLSLSIDSHLQLLEHAVIMCEQVLDIDNCVIYEYQPKNHNLKCVAIAHSNANVQLSQAFDLDPSSSQAAYALDCNEATATDDFRTETRFKNVFQSNSALSVVIPGREQAYGVLSVFKDDVKPDIEEDLYFLQAVANVLGSFAESSQAHQAEREQREFAEALQNATAIVNTQLSLPEMLDKLMTYVLQVVPQVESGSIMLWDVAEQSYRFIYTWGFQANANEVVTERSFAADEFPLMQKMMGDHRPMIIANVDDEPDWVRTNDIEYIRSYLGAPIIVQGESIGFFHLNSTVLNAFSEHDATRLQTFADKIGTAILSARYALELEQLVKERTEELQRERERLTSILESSGEGVLYVENYVIKFANQSAADITGYSIEELIGMDSRKFRPDDLSQEDIDMLNSFPSDMKIGTPWRGQLRQKRKDGTIIYVGLTNSRLPGISEDDYYSVIIMRDISQEKALDIAKSRFIANAAHELRSPITSLKTRMYMINKQPEKVDYHISRLDQIVSRMNRLVSDLLDMSYFEYGQVTLRPETIILQDVIESIIGILDAEAELAKLSLLRELPETPIHIWADVHRIEQVLTNLIVNAIHYTPAGGQVRVICSLDEDEQTACICVEDTGDGIPAEHLDHVFEAFYRLDNKMEKKGTGLGLSISREIVKLHEGTIRIESETGKGTSFIVTLPLLSE